MKILLDACVPRPLRTFLANHTVKTAQEMGWGKLKNGALLRAVEADFDTFISTDKNLKYQQNVRRQRLAILVLPTNDWPTLRLKGDKIAAKIAALKPGDFVEMDLEEHE
jgi:predicted nuclease of predicted toxin-antitoxin system